jgi:hypothetical protein
MNTTTSPVHDNRIFAPQNRMFGPQARMFAPENRMFSPKARMFAPEARMFAPASTSCTSSPARLAGQSPGLARPGVGWLRRP